METNWDLDIVLTELSNSASLKKKAKNMKTHAQKTNKNWKSKQYTLKSRARAPGKQIYRSWGLFSTNHSEKTALVIITPIFN